MSPGLPSVLQPDRLRATPPPAYGGRQWGFLALVTGAGVLVPLVFGGDAYTDGLLTEALTASVLALGFFWCFSIAGKFTFAAYAMYAVGAYLSVWGANHLGGFWSGLLLAMLGTGAVGALTCLVFGRLGPIHFAIATIAVAGLLLMVVGRAVSLTGGFAGIGDIPVPSVLGLELDTTHRRYYLMLAVLAAFLAASVAMIRSPAMRDLMMARDKGPIAATAGLRPRGLVLVAFAVGSAMQGAAGSLYAHNSTYFSAASFDFTVSLDVLLMVLLGGVASIYGPVIGAVLLVYLPELLRGAAAYSYPIYAGLVLVIVLAFPGGIAGTRAVLETGLRRLTDRYAAAGAGTGP